jgi:hypothetical protein
MRDTVLSGAERMGLENRHLENRPKAGARVRVRVRVRVREVLLAAETLPQIRQLSL